MRRGRSPDVTPDELGALHRRPAPSGWRRLLRPGADRDLDRISVRVRGDLIGGTVVLRASVPGEAIVPRVETRPRKDGVVTVRPVGRRRIVDAYASFVASVGLRVALDALARTEAVRAIVHVEARTLDPATGLLSDRPVLSVLVPRATTREVDVTRLDALSALRLFVHEIDHHPEHGLGPVRRLRPDELPEGP
ncbi:MAG TPA: hypothetical protein VI997_10620 [Candidatus Thermoplasmatota archaeon]|nr:hypothetical protein [Candidatus Thermoplasmatota archaeon]